MSAEEDKNIEETEAPSREPEVLKPKPPPRLAQAGIQTFTMHRVAYESGVSGPGTILEGIILGVGTCVVHWLTPPPKGSIAIFDSIDDFKKVHINPHPTNKTIITWDDGTQEEY